MFTVLIVTACGNENVHSNNEDILRFINGDAIPSMDPALATDEYAFQFLGSTMEGLYRLDESGEPTEGIAIDHDVSKDGLIWAFHLRKDAKWSNGDPVTAHDFVYAWRRVVDPQTGSEYAYMFHDVIKNATEINQSILPVEELGVHAKDDYTLLVELENPTPYFESLTTFGTFLPLHKEFVEEQGDRFATSTETLLFNGPYTLEDWKSTAQDWHLAKNEMYWDKDTVQIERIQYNVSKKPNTNVALYNNGDIDRTDLSSQLVDVYGAHQDYRSVPESAVYFLKMNQQNKYLENANIRKAISRAFNKEALVHTILNNGSVPAHGLIPFDFVRIPDTDRDFREVNGDLITYDVEKAREYWEKGLEELGTKSITLEYLGGDSEVSKQMDEYIANQLMKNLPGLTIELKNVPFKQRLDLDTKMDYDIQNAGWSPDYLDPNTFLDLWVTDGGNNKMAFSHPEYDQLIKETATIYANDNQKRYENFLKAEKILLEEEAAIAPIFQKASAQLVSPKMEGIFMNPFGPKYEYKWARIKKEMES